MKKKTKKPSKKKVFITKKQAIRYIQVLVILILTFAVFKKIFFVLLFVSLNSGLAILKRIAQFPVEPEFKTFGIVVITLKYGFNYGAIFIIIATIMSIVFRQRFNAQMIAELVTDFILLSAALYLPISNLVLLGIIVSIMNVIFIFIMLQFVFMVPPAVTITATVSNLFFNIVLFNSFGSFFMSLM